MCTVGPHYDIDASDRVHEPDLELILGWHDKPAKVYETKLAEIGATRGSAVEVLAILDSAGVPATWCVASHLLLAECAGHPEYPDQGWLARDPRTGVESDPAWYAPDIVQQLKNSAVGHDIGCHAFAHGLFDVIHREQAEAELRMSAELARQSGLDMRSFTFPRNKIGHLGAVAEFGYTSFRTEGVDTGSRGRKAADLLFGIQVPQPVQPFITKSGIVAIPPSYNMTRAGYSRLTRSLSRIPRNYFRWAFSAGLEQTVRSGGVFHIWTHPADYGGGLRPSDFIFVVEETVRARDRGDLRLCTMAELADEVLAA